MTRYRIRTEINAFKNENDILIGRICYGSGKQNDARNTEIIHSFPGIGVLYSI